MRVREGTIGQRALFSALVLVYLVGFAVDVGDKMQRVGAPDVGWMIDSGYISPTRHDASEAGLRGGGRALVLNGQEIEPDPRGRYLDLPSLRTSIGESNTLVFRSPSGEIRELTIPVREWQWKDVVFTEGATSILAILFFVVGAVTFVLRPFEATSWALLSLCSFAGGLLHTLLIPLFSVNFIGTVYFLVAAGIMSYLPLHTALAFPVIHPILIRYTRVLWLIYGLGVVQAGLYLGAWYTHWTGFFVYARPLGAGALLISIVIFVGRCLQLALNAKDPLVMQRARILLIGTVLGLVPVALVQFMQETFDRLPIDNRFLYWSLGIFLIALARVTLRYELLDARVAVRRAFIYAGAVGVLTVLAILLGTVRPYAVALLLFPLLYWWPRFDARLNARLYPKRARFPELVRTIGEEIAECASVDAVLMSLSLAPGRLCDARSSVAFVLRGFQIEAEQARAAGVSPTLHGPPLAEEPLVQLQVTTRKELFRDRLYVEPQYSNIRDECMAGFDRLSADVLLPLLRGNRVIGGLAIGPRTTGDTYESAEIDALSTVTQQAVQALIRVEATERLRKRELEFADLKRFFPPQVIDQIMARGGVAELRSQRKPVTVFFSDLRGFTAFSDSVEPEEVMATLDEYHAAMGRRIAEFAGTLERFVGDGLMVFFNDPIEQVDHVERAVRMAIAMRSDVRKLRGEWVRRGYQIDVGMGIHTGFATCGFIGYEGRRDYGVIGNVTNLAARLSDAAGPGEILISARIHGELRNGFRVEPAGELHLKGFHQPQAAYRLVES